MTTRDERELFADEQAYIAWKRQQAAEVKAEALKAAQARAKRRRVKYGERVRRALNNIRMRRWRASVYADPERHAALKLRHREYRRSYNAQHADLLREYQRRFRQKHRETLLLESQIYHNEHRETVNARRAANRKKNADRERAYQNAYRKAHPEMMQRYRARTREQHAQAELQRYRANRDEINARRRERAAARKLANMNSA